MPDHTQETPPQRNEKRTGRGHLQNSRQEARSQAGDWAPSKGVRGQKPSAVPEGGARNECCDCENLLGEYLVGDRSLSRSLSKMQKSRLSQALAKLRAVGQKVAVCETSAGGLVASALLAEAGASKFFAGGVVGYSKAAKQTFLGLDPESSKPTSTEPHAIELAEACRAILQTEWAIGETGVAGPSPNSRGISPGVCAIAVVGPNGFVRSEMLYPDDTLSAEDAYGCEVDRTDMIFSLHHSALL